jgi:hypothetical protein
VENGDIGEDGCNVRERERPRRSTEGREEGRVSEKKPLARKEPGCSIRLAFDSSMYPLTCLDHCRLRQ